MTKPRPGAPRRHDRDAPAAGEPISAPRDGHRLSALAHAHPAPLFIVLALGLTWLVWIPPLAADSSAQWPLFLGAFGPAVAGAVMTRLHGGTIRPWLSGLLRFRVGGRWYAAALLVPAIDPIIQAVLASQAGVALSAGLLDRAPLYLGSFILVLLIGGGQEEFGWRGWLLPHLQRRLRPLPASVLIGVVHAGWHLPLFVFGASNYEDAHLWTYLPHVVGGAVVFTWLYNRGRRSVVIAMLFHAQINVASALVPVASLGEYEAAIAGGAVSTTALQSARAAAWLMAALVLVVRDRNLGLRETVGPERRS